MATSRNEIHIAEQDANKDLGFGSVLSNRRNFRLLNRDGTFNVRRNQRNFWASFSTYHALLSMPTRRFFAVVVVGYVLLNCLFAVGYVLCGPAALQGSAGVAPFLRAFFFSVYTFATIGYGNIVPVGLPANILVTMESLFGLLSFALATGLLFARFSRPVADILYSKRALVAPYGDGTAFQFRVMNARDNELVEVQAMTVLSRFELCNGIRQRKYYQLVLERTKVAFFPLNWTVVHPIDEASPLFGWNDERLREAEAEFLILLTAIDETFAQTVHSRSSYIADEVIWGARFLPLIEGGESGEPTVNVSRFHGFVRLQDQITK